MPAVYDSLRLERGLSSHVSWRIAFIVPTILLISCGLLVLFCCEDTPTGRWADRHENLARLAAGHGAVVSGGGVFDEEALSKRLEEVKEESLSSSKKSEVRAEVNEAATPAGLGGVVGKGEEEVVQRVEVVVAPSWKEIVPALMCPQTIMLALP